VFNGTATYGAGAGYLKHNAVNKGDRYNAFDCVAVTTNAGASPCVTAMTVAQRRSLAIGGGGVAYPLETSERCP
jgi:hypothetical protein